MQRDPAVEKIRARWWSVGFFFAFSSLGCSGGAAGEESGHAATGGKGGSGGTNSTGGVVTGGGGGTAGGGAPGTGGASGGLGGTGGASGASASGGGGASGAGNGGAAGSAGTSGSASGVNGGASGNGGKSGSAGAGGNGGIGGRGGNGGGGRGGASGSGDVTLNPTPGNYRQTCDGSLGVALDADHFLDGNDENQGMRVYRRGADANPLATIDVSSPLGLSTSDEADLEDAARIDNRIYVVSSHGRDKDGNLERERYRFFALNVSGTSPNVTLTGAGSATTLLDQMLVSANWTTPNTGVIATLNAASDLGEPEDADLAPKVNGTSIEALAWMPTAARPKQLLIGFRNPTQGSSAIVVSLLNADAVLTGATASFGEVTLLELGGLGLRAMTWSPLHAAILVLAGPKAGGGPYRLFKWSGPPSTSPALVQEVTTPPSDSSPEAIVVYPNTRDVEILFDQGDHLVSGTACKDVSESSRFFSDVIVRVP